MNLHKKMLGSLGELKVAGDLISRGYHVFSELGDCSTTDLICLIGDTPVKLQVKTRTSRLGKVSIETKKSGPNYSYSYSSKDVDVFAVYVFDKDEIFYISSSEILNCSSSFTLRINNPKNNQMANVKFARDYGSFERALRDYTPTTLTINDEGDEIVQTATD